MTTSAPLDANALAIDPPISPEPPVTMATLFRKSIVRPKANLCCRRLVLLGPSAKLQGDGAVEGLGAGCSGRDRLAAVRLACAKDCATGTRGAGSSAG